MIDGIERLPGGGIEQLPLVGMAKLTQAFEWSRTSLGKADDWSPSLRQTTDLMLASGHAMCLMWGAERIFLYNDAYAPLLGSRHPAALGITAEEVWPEVWGDIAPLIERTFAGETCTFDELPLTMTRHGHKEETWWSFSYSPVRDGGGDVVGLLNVTMEVTPQVLALRQRDAAIAELRTSERFMASVLAASTDCIKVLELDGTVSFMSEGGMQTMELDDFEGVKGCPWTDLLKDGAVDLASEAIIAARQGQSSHFEMAADTFAGTPKFWSVTVSPMFNDAGQVSRILSVSRDHTVLEQTRAQQRRLNESLEEIVAERTAERDRMWVTSPDLMLVIDFGGVFRRVNPAWTALLAYEPSELIGHHVNEFVVPDDHDVTTIAYEDAADGRRPTVENRYRHKDGSVRWIAWTAAPAGDMTYATGRDVTAEKDQARALAKTEEQLRQAQKMEAVGQLTGGLAHDFNNLLTAVTGGLELLQARLAKGEYDKTERYINMALTGANRAAALTQRLLAFSRRQTLAPKSTDVDRLIAGMEEIIDRTLGPSINVKVVSAAGLWPVLVDAPQLDNALLNLCINARDAMPDGGQLTIETSNKVLDARSAALHDLSEGEYVSLCVTDTGTGMSPEVIKRVFEPFFTTKPIGEGTGLGLSMIYGFVRQSGGQVRIHSVVGEGSTICLYLPRLTGEHQVVVAEEDNGAGLRAEQGQTVLLVEDEAAIRELVVTVLEEAGYRVVEAPNGPAGTAILRSNQRVDLLITDVGLPGGLNGRQVADAGRTVRPELKVLFMTGYAANAAVGAGHLVAGMEVLTKPFNVSDLKRRVGEMLSG